MNIVFVVTQKCPLDPFPRFFSRTFRVLLAVTVALFSQTMIALLLAAGRSARYPLLLGVPPSVSASTPEALAVPGVLPENLTVFAAERPIADLRALSAWANASSVCARVGKTLAFPAVDPGAFDFLAAVRALYATHLGIDTASECTCKVRHFRKGLILVRVRDSEIGAVRTVTEGLPRAMAYAFVPAAPTL
jgi:hypothetical protein